MESGGSIKKGRQVIVGNVGRRPYGARMGIILSSTNRFGFEGETCLLVQQDMIVRLIPEIRKEGEFEFQKFSAFVEGFGTAGEAEQAGLKLALSVLWASVSMECPLRLEYHTPLPCVVYDRTQGKGLIMSGTAHTTVTTPAPAVVDMLDQVFSSTSAVNPNLLISMELFAGARLETTERARFIGLVSALEPLAQQQALGGEADRFVEDAINLLRSRTGIGEDLRPSLEGRIHELARESVAQAIVRLVKTHLPGDTDAPEKVKEAYAIRSKILHEGSTDADLREKSAEIQAVIRSIYASVLGRELRSPVSG